MIQPVEKKYCIGNLVQVMPNTEACHLIVSVDEIILLRVGDRILVNKYVNHPSRNLFPYQEKEMYDWCHFTELFEYNKKYLNFKGSLGGGVFLLDYFFRTNDNTLWLEENLPVEYRYNDSYVGENSVVLNRKEIEEEFDSGNYDSIYVIDGNGIILFARNDKEKIRFGENFIPSDEKIVEMELELRKEKYKWDKLYYILANDTEKDKKATMQKTIDEIRNFTVYGPTGFGEYYHLLLTSKDGKFNLRWVKIDFVEKDKFKLTSSPISILEPKIDDVIQFSSNNEIDNAPKTSKSILSFEQVHTSETQEMNMNTINSIIDGNNQQEPDKLQNNEKGDYKRLRKLF